MSQSLNKILGRYPALALAFSGGADSSVLLAAASRIVPRVLAVQCVGPLCPPWEIERAGRLARELKVEFMQINARELEQAQIVANDEQRCYYCKHHKMNGLKALAAGHGFSAVADGSQADDFRQQRPGNRALKELGIISPLAEAGLDKSQVLHLARSWGLPVPAPSACLATRIPTHQPLTAERLLRIGRAENILRRHFSGIMRLRDFFPRARLEVERREMAKAAGLLEEIKPLGYETLEVAVYTQ